MINESKIETKYLNKLQQNLKIGNYTSVGVSESEIRGVEVKFNIKFPLAYREFLLMAGENKGGLLFHETTDLKTLSADWFQTSKKPCIQRRFLCH